MTATNNQDALAQAAFGRAVALHQAGRLAEAERAYREAIGARGDHFEACFNLGILLGQMGRWDQTVAAFERVVALRPREAEGWKKLGVAYKATGKLEQALRAFGQVVSLRPDDVEGNCFLGDSLKMAGRLDAATAAYGRALALRPDCVDAYCGLGDVMYRQRRLPESIAAYRRAVALRPVLPAAHVDLSVSLWFSGQYEAALAECRIAVAQDPNNAQALVNLGNALKEQGDLAGALELYDRALALEPGRANFRSNRVYTMLFDPRFDAAAILAAEREWDRLHAEPVRGKIGAHGNDRSPERRLRVGYVSANFCDHVVGHNVLPLLREHDREQVEVYCYSNVSWQDGWTDRFRAASEQWRDISTVSHDRAAQMIRDDAIDILVDLTMHMAGNRLPVFAHKPAPVQVTFAAYPGGTGLATMDYRLTDLQLDPPGENDGQYREETVRLAETFWCYSAMAGEAVVGALPAKGNGCVTFGCLNNFCKVNDGTLALWAKVLTAVAGSRLLMLAPVGEARERVLRGLVRHGIEAGRVEFVGHQARARYLETYQRIDVGLDTLPYNGHTTSLDSYWMGVPVVTLVGKTVVGRAGLSQLSNLGMGELAARTEEEFVGIAAGLAGDLPRLSEIRSTLRERMRGSALMDGRRFARSIEAAYRAMWRRWCGQGTA